jgi:hypothetical protein
MRARGWIAAGILAIAAGGCAPPPPTFADAPPTGPEVIPFAPPTDTAGFVPAPGALP